MQPPKIIVPAANQKIDAGTRDAVKDFLERHLILERMPNCLEFEIEIFEATSDLKMSLCSAHRTWTPVGIRHCAAVDKFPQQKLDSECQQGTTKLSIRCINKRTGGMNSRFGFEGTYVSMLISLEDDLVWDVRSDLAD